MDRVTGIRLTDPSGEEYRLYEYAYDREGNLAGGRDIREDLGEETIETVAVAGGAYGEATVQASQAGAQAFVVGEIHHHEILDAAARGLWVLDAGHHATEQPGIAALYQRFLRDASQTGWAVQARLIDTAPFPKEPVR